MHKSKEIPLQYDLFSGDLVDNRSGYQKRRDKDRQAPQQLLMFATREVVQLGENVRPWLAQMDRPELILAQEDPRTTEEIEHDLQQQAEDLTYSLFAEEALPETEQQSIPDPSPAPAKDRQKPILIPIYVAADCDQVAIPQVDGYRKRQRQAGLKVRSRFRIT